MNPSLASIIAATQAGHFAEAEALCRTYLQAVPDDADALFFLATSLHYRQQLDEALPIYEKLVQHEPDSSVHWGNYATALGEAGRIQEAKAAFKTALQYPPHEAGTLFNYGRLLLHDEASLLEARDVLLRAHALAPVSAEIGLFAARACNICGDYRIDHVIKHWRSWLPLKGDDQIELARLLLATGDAERARELIEDVCNSEPDNRHALLQLANIYERLNRETDAEEILDQIASRWPDLATNERCEYLHARANLALRRKDPTLAHSLLIDADVRDEGDADHYFDLADTCDKLHQTDAAMQALAEGHAIQIRKVRLVAAHLFEENRPIFPRTAARVTAQDYAAWPQRVAPQTKQSPIFIVGFPRSGTTLLEQMLDAHPSLQSMDERPFFHILADELENFGAYIPKDIGKLSQQDCDELRKGYVTLACAKVPRRWDAQLVDKNPLNMLWLPMIHRLFPRAKFILAIRHPCDVMLSCYMQNFRAGVLAAACADLQRLALGYVEAMQHWLHHVQVFSPDVLVSRYEDLVANTPERLARIAHFLELDDATPMLGFKERAREKGFIATPSYTQVIEPVSTKSIGRWKRYQQYFEPVLPILDPLLKHWGYADA